MKTAFLPIVLALAPLFVFAQKSYVGASAGIEKIHFFDRQDQTFSSKTSGSFGQRVGMVGGWRLGKNVFFEAGFFKNWERFDQKDQYSSPVFDPITGLQTGTELIENRYSYRSTALELPVSIGATVGKKSLRAFGQIGIVAQTTQLNDLFETPPGRGFGGVKPGPDILINSSIPFIGDDLIFWNDEDKVGGFLKLGLEKSFARRWMLRAAWAGQSKKVTSGWSVFRRQRSSGFETSLFRLF